MKQKGIVYLSPDNLLTHPKNLRRFYPENQVREMAQSIRARKGVTQAMQIVPNGAKGKFFVVDGNMRLAGARALGKDCPPLKCEVVNESEADQLLTMLVTAKFRYEPDPISEALHYKRLMEEEKYSIEAISKASGVGVFTIERRLKLLELDQEIQELIAKKELPADIQVTNSLLSIPNGKARVKMAQRLAKDGLSIKAIVASCDKLAARMQETAQRDQDGGGAFPFAIKKTGRKPAPESKVPVSNIRQAAKEMCKACLARESSLKKAPEPAWAIVQRAADCTCGRCNIRDVDGACKSCPAVELIKRLIDADGN